MHDYHVRTPHRGFEIVVNYADEADAHNRPYSRVGSTIGLSFGLNRPPHLKDTTEKVGDSPLSQRSAIAKVDIAIVMYKLPYPSIRVRIVPPVSVRVRTRVSVSFSLRIFAIADLNQKVYH